MKTIQPISVQAGFCRPAIDESDDFIRERPNLTPREVREIQTNLLNYMSHRIVELTQPAWPWDRYGNPIDKRLIEE